MVLRACLRVRPGCSEEQPIVAPRRDSTQGRICDMVVSCPTVRKEGMEVVYPRCCGLDVHKRTVVACLIVPGADGQSHREIRTFEALTDDLLQLADWLSEQGVTHVAMEATGVYWKPVWNLLEGDTLTLLLVNAHHIKAVPGRKTDVRDCEWGPEGTPDLLRHGLPRGSYVPDRLQRELRELTRYRTSLIRERSTEVSRLQKTLKGANITLVAVASNMMGKSGWEILAELAAESGTDLGRFPSADHLASWVGMVPGNNESAGKRRSGAARKGDPWLRVALVQAAHAAGRTKDTYLRAQDRRLAARRGKKKAAVAVGHAILVIAYHLLTHQINYQDLGPHYFAERDREGVKRRLVRRLEDLGYAVTVTPAPVAA